MKDLMLTNDDNSPITTSLEEVFIRINLECAARLAMTALLLFLSHKSANSPSWVTLKLNLLQRAVAALCQRLKLLPSFSPSSRGRHRHAEFNADSNIRRMTKIMMRWWWFGSSVQSELGREMRLMKEGGIGGLKSRLYPLCPMINS
jgi:hypothetical protein